jgi:hypothetical protein
MCATVLAGGDELISLAPLPMSVFIRTLKYHPTPLSGLDTSKARVVIVLISSLGIYEYDLCR